MLDRVLCKGKKMLFIIRNPSQEQSDLETEKLCTSGFCSKLKDEKNYVVDINETRERQHERTQRSSGRPRGKKTRVFSLQSPDVIPNITSNVTGRNLV